MSLSHPAEVSSGVRRHQRVSDPSDHGCQPRERLLNTAAEVQPKVTIIWHIYKIKPEMYINAISLQRENIFKMVEA